MENNGLKTIYLRSLIVLVILVCYYFGVTLIQVPEDQQWIFVSLIFGGYFALGFAFGFLFKKTFTNAAFLFAFSFLGAMLSIVSYGILLNRSVIPQTWRDLTTYLYASFFISIAVAAGAFINTLITWIAHRLSGKRRNQRERQANKDRPRAAGVM